jgi:hypothetical protein
MVAIVPDWLEIAKLPAYKYTITPTKGLGAYDSGQRPVDRVVAFISDYLRVIDDAIVVCENFRWTRRTYENWTDGRLPPVSCYSDDEVYHVLRLGIESDLIEDAIRFSQGHCGTTVCSLCERPQMNNDINEDFLNAIVRKAQHVIIPAFGGDGMLIWSLDRRDH